MPLSIVQRVLGLIRRPAQGLAGTLARRRLAALSLATCAAVLCLGATAVWWWGEVEMDLPPHRIRQGQPPLRVVYLQGDMEITRLTEDGVALGPRLRSQESVRDHGPGSWTHTVVESAEGGDRTTVVAFIPNTRRPARAGPSRYEVRAPLRTRSASRRAVVVIWLLLPLVALTLWRTGGWQVLATSRRSLPLAAWSVLVIVLFYSLFSFQASLVFVREAPWFVGLSALTSLLLLAPGVRSPSVRAWWLPVGCLLAWAWSTQLLPGTLHASPAAALGATLICLLGFALVTGCRGRLAVRTGAPATLLFLLWAAVTAAVVLRAGGIELQAVLAAIGLTPFYGPDIWAAKFSIHWFLVLTWCSLLAMAQDGIVRRLGSAVPVVAAGTLVAVLTSGSATAVASFLGSLTVAVLALRWPRPVRRGLVVGTVCLCLLAPAVYRVPWQVQQRASDQVTDLINRADLSVRGSVWEAAARLVADRPWTGRGFGAASRLPEGRISLAERLDIADSDLTPKQRGNRVLPGGHPHSLPLLIWLDLGVVGAVLMTVLVLAVARVVAKWEQCPRTHACLLGLFSLTAAVFAVNYPAWDPTVLSILWLGPALATALLPPVRDVTGA